MIQVIEIKRIKLIIDKRKYGNHCTKQTELKVPGSIPQWKLTLGKATSNTVKLIVLVVTQERVSVLYTGHVKDPDGLFE